MQITYFNNRSEVMYKYKKANKKIVYKSLNCGNLFASRPKAIENAMGFLFYLFIRTYTFFYLSI